MKKMMVTILISMLFFSLIIGNIQPYIGKINSEEQRVFAYEKSCSDVADNGDIDGWPMLSHDPAHTGYSTSTAPDTNDLLFEKTIGGSDSVFSGVSVDNGKAYILSANKHIYCINAYTGETIYDRTNPGALFSVPAIDGDRLYFGSFDDNFYCLDSSTGDTIWTFPTGGKIQGSPTLANDNIYSGDHGNNMWCIDTNGNEIWSYATGGAIVSSPVVVKGRVYFGSDDNKVYCLNAANGRYEWDFPPDEFPHGFRGTPAVANDKVYIGSTDSNIYYCLNAADGTPEWSFPTVSRPGSAAVHDGKVYFGLDNGHKFYCLDADTGQELWNYSATGYSGSTPAIADGKIYFGDSSSRVYCLNANNGSNIWTYHTGAGTIHTAFAIYDGIVYVAVMNKIYAFGSNEPPDTPDQPSGPTNLDAGGEYTYSTSTTDPESDQVYYKWDWGDSSFSDWLGPYDSGETVEATHVYSIEGIFEIKAKAKDIYDAESEWSPKVIVNIKKQLVISVSSSVVEGDSFQVTVMTADETPEDVQVEFNGQTMYTDSEGKAIFTAPQVEADTDYSITASKEEYSSDTTLITVLDQENIVEEGWVYGVVYDDSGAGIEGASVCVIISDIGGSTTSECVSTDENGGYYVLVPVGTYAVKASKLGFETSTNSDVLVKEKHAIESNFVLTPSGEIIDEEQEKIEQAIEAGNVGAEIRVLKDNGDILSEEMRYADVTITPHSIDTKNKRMKFVVDGETETGNTVVIFTIDKSALTLDDITVEYDGEVVGMADDIDDILDPSNEDTPEYLVMIGANEIQILVSMPLSAHTIAISSVVKAVGGIIAVILYVAICVIAGTMFLSRFYARPVYLTFFRKKKQ